MTLLPELTTIPAHTVRLHLWGLTDRDLASAVENARAHPSYYSWHVIETTRDVGCPSPIRSGDPQALGQRAYYGWAWAAYPAMGRSR